MVKSLATSSSRLRAGEITTVENTTTYHEIDFLLPTQRFNINFSYITQKGMPFVREFVLRLIHLAPMSKTQIGTFFGFSRKEVEEAIADLVSRDELTLSESGRLTLTEKSLGYFTEIGEVPRLSVLRDSTACLSFDLATFTCLGKVIDQDKWKAGLPIRVEDDNTARSETHVEKHFQRQFNELLHRELLSKSLIQDEKDTPSVYTVNSVNKIRQTPLRLTVKFRSDADGRNVEREDFEVLKSSDYVHERIAFELDRLSRPGNLMDIVKAMMELGDSETLKLFDSKTNTVNLSFLDELKKLESNSQDKRMTFLGPIYLQENWQLLQRHLAPVLASRIESSTEVENNSFLWIAPSDPYWSKSNRLSVALSDFLLKAKTKEKKLYAPTLYVPVLGPDDHRTSRQWKQELDPYANSVRGLVEGFLGGNVEILLLEGELTVIIYHLSAPDSYPVTVPVGFISTDKHFVSNVGKALNAYVKGSSGLNRPNDCGPLA